MGAGSGTEGGTVPVGACPHFYDAMGGRHAHDELLEIAPLDFQASIRGSIMPTFLWGEYGT